MTNQWTSPNDALPDRGKPVLCAWKLTTKWEYAIAKWTGKRWLDVVPETTNEEYRPPYYWQEIQSPDSAVEPSADEHKFCSVYSPGLLCTTCGKPLPEKSSREPK